MNSNILTNLSDMKRFVEESENHLQFLMRSFNFYSHNNINLDDIVCNIQNHITHSGATKRLSSECRLPSPIANKFLEDERLKYVIDDDTRNFILSSVRQNGVIPPRATTVDEYMASFSSVEKNILYDHALKNTIRIETPPELLLPEPEAEENIDESKLSEEELRLKKLEMMKRERDMKRRRIAYRKKVSTKNKTLNEVTREMISNVMEALYGKIVDDEATIHEDTDLVREREDSQFQNIESRKYDKNFDKCYEKPRSRRCNSKDREKSRSRDGYEYSYQDREKRMDNRSRVIERSRKERSRDDYEYKYKGGSGRYEHREKDNDYYERKKYEHREKDNDYYERKKYLREDSKEKEKKKERKDYHYSSFERRKNTEKYRSSSKSSESSRKRN